MAVKKEINWDMVELYIKAGCSQAKIADSLFIHRETLADRVQEKYGKDYSTFSTALRSEGEMMIEAHQYQKAMKGYWPALQWLGKVKLGQREPELLGQLATNQIAIDQSQYIMQLEHRLAERDNADKSKTE